MWLNFQTPQKTNPQDQNSDPNPNPKVPPAGHTCSGLASPPFLAVLVLLWSLWLLLVWTLPGTTLRDHLFPFGWCFGREGPTLANPVLAIVVLAQPIWAKTNFGQSNFGQSISGSGVFKRWGPNPEISGPEGWGPEGWAPERSGPEGWGGAKFSRFSPFPAPIFALFVSFWVSRRILVVFSSAGGLKCARLGLTGCRAKPRRPRSRQGFTRQPENPKRAHLRSAALQTPPKFHEK